MILPGGSFFPALPLRIGAGITAADCAVKVSISG